MLAVWLLIGCLFVIMFLRIGLPFGVEAAGRTVARVRLSFRERLLWHRADMYALGAVLLLSAIGGWFPTTLELVLILMALAIVNLPVHYRLTDRGIACNNVFFRPWEEFEYATLRGWKLTLIPRQGAGRLRLALSPKHQRELLPYLSRFLQIRELSEAGRSERFRLRVRALQRYFPALRTLLIFAGLLVLSLVLLSACGAGPDPNGLNSSDQQHLTSVTATGTQPSISQDDVNKAKTSEPFAYNLALYVDQNRLAINFVWTLVTGYLVMFMQAGFALVETGLCRAKNAGHTMAMNFMIYGIGMIGYFVVGFAFQFGGIGLVGVPNLGGLSSLTNELTIPIGGINWGIVGYKGFFLNDGTYDVGVAVMFLFQMVFMDTTATIPTGAMAERWKWSAFCVYGFFVSTLVYPIYGNWAWGGGWLSQLGKIGLGAGYIDFAGSGVVHAVGGWCALAGAMVIGPRLGKYNRDGSPNTIPGHNMVLALLGCFILAFGWFGFNPGSTLGASGNGNLRIGLIAVDTMLAGAFGSVAAMLFTWLTGAKKPDIGMMGNGLLAGLVAITAPSGYVSPVSACIIGAVAGIIVILAAGFVEKVLKVDDPVGAIAVHGFNGLWGQISVGLFADGLANYGGLQVRGLFFGDPSQLVAQLIGAVACFVYVFGISWLFFKAYDKLFGLRVSPETELAGLDIPEMGSLGYAPDAEPYRVVAQGDGSVAVAGGAASKD
ncbi:ammonium transporter [Thermogemmatispora onikobensis]|uniref:ammonium transporter n=1 Tax=Thermogemmatispora onikobensis TaxID=732234 RepID=UPI000B272EFC|nr:ammonium transporter [Thermogemmatispora onikobensis]